MPNIELTQELVKKNFTYNNGALYYNYRTGHQIAGALAGWFEQNTLTWRIKINKKSYLLHRVIFLYHKGYLPKFVDHADRNKSNNYIENLREATSSENMANRKSQIGSHSQYLGVHFRKVVNYERWIAQCIKNGKLMGKIYCTTENEAALAYNRMAVMHHKEFANMNIIKPCKA